MESSLFQAVACFFPPTDFLNYGKPGQVALGRGALGGLKAAFAFREFDTKTKTFIAVKDEEQILKIGRRVALIRRRARLHRLLDALGQRIGQEGFFRANGSARHGGCRTLWHRESSFHLPRKGCGSALSCRRPRSNVGRPDGTATLPRAVRTAALSTGRLWAAQAVNCPPGQMLVCS